MAEIALRAPTLADVEETVALVNREARRLRGRDAVDELALRGWWTQPPPFDLSRDVVLAVDELDRIVGYGDLGDQANDGTVLWLDVRGASVEPVLVELERRALERRAPEGVVRAVADERDEGYRTLLAARGYEPVRASWRMVIDLAETLPLDAAWPAGGAVRTAVEGADEPLLHQLVERSFADHWGFTPTPYDEWLHWLREMGTPDPSLWFVAELDGAPVGIALCRPGEWGDPDCGWVAQLGVVPEARGRGLGSCLLAHALASFRARGQPRGGLEVDTENTTGAVRLYERVGLRVVERHDTWELRL